jgi:hypothetical protein
VFLPPSSSALPPVHHHELRSLREGHLSRLHPPKVLALISNTVAGALREGDVILSVNGKDVYGGSPGLSAAVDRVMARQTVSIATPKVHEGRLIVLCYQRCSLQLEVELVLLPSSDIQESAEQGQAEEAGGEDDEGGIIPVHRCLGSRASEGKPQLIQRYDEVTKTHSLIAVGTSDTPKTFRSLVCKP